MSQRSAYPSETDWPVDREAIRFFATRPPDSKGRQCFHALFWINGRRQSLAQFGKPQEHARRAQAEGRTADVVEFGAELIAA